MESANGRSFSTARAEFWSRVNHEDSPNAAFVRRMLAAAGYQLRTGKLAPVLAMAWDDPFGSRSLSDRILSIDHAFPQKYYSFLGTEPFNLRFMTKRENSFRGNSQDENDHPYVPGTEGPKPKLDPIDRFRAEQLRGWTRDRMERE